MCFITDKIRVIKIIVLAIHRAFLVHKMVLLGSDGFFSVKESVEKNLLSDIALAIHSGISFEEIISDLTKPGKYLR